MREERGGSLYRQTDVKVHVFKGQRGVKMQECWETGWISWAVEQDTAQRLCHYTINWHRKRDQWTDTRAALSENNEPCMGAMPLLCALCSREHKKIAGRILRASTSFLLKHSLSVPAAVCHANAYKIQQFVVHSVRCMHERFRRWSAFHSLLWAIWGLPVTLK